MTLSLTPTFTLTLILTKACSQGDRKAPCPSGQEGRGRDAQRRAAMQRGYRHAK